MNHFITEINIPYTLYKGMCVI